MLNYGKKICLVTRGRYLGWASCTQLPSLEGWLSQLLVPVVSLPSWDCPVLLLHVLGVEATREECEKKFRDCFCLCLQTQPDAQLAAALAQGLLPSSGVFSGLKELERDSGQRPGGTEKGE